MCGISSPDLNSKPKHICQYNGTEKCISIQYFLKTNCNKPEKHYFHTALL